MVVEEVVYVPGEPGFDGVSFDQIINEPGSSRLCKIVVVLSFVSVADERRIVAE